MFENCGSKNTKNKDNYIPVILMSIFPNINIHVIVWKK